MKTPYRVQEKSKRLEKLQCQVLTYLKQPDNVLIQDCNHFGISWVTNLPLDMSRETHYKRQVQSKRYSTVMEMPLATQFSFFSFSFQFFFISCHVPQYCGSPATIQSQICIQLFCQILSHITFHPFSTKIFQSLILKVFNKKPLEIIESIFQNECEKNYLHKHRS